MLNKLKNRKEEGFTIIEVLIVLAIAGLILLIVFLAVPALQRNSRNTQYRTDASRILGAIQEDSNNKNGLLPGATGGPTATSIMALVNNQSIKTISSIETKKVSAITADLSAAVVDTGVSCGTLAADKVTPALAATRSVILIYGVEAADGSVIAQCTAS